MQSITDQIHVVLLGDSTFDSRPYLRAQSDMTSRLAERANCRATLLAESGSRLADIAKQLARMPSDATHLWLSAGGNDLLDLGRGLHSQSGDIVAQFGKATGMLGDFRRRLRMTCKRVATLGLPTACCTIYQPPVSDPVLRQLGSAAVSLVNTAIRAEASSNGLSIVDLREICRKPADFHDPIHPSAIGADNICEALAVWLLKLKA
jgi:lysophospholipase L1-like esterase